MHVILHRVGDDTNLLQNCLGFDPASVDQIGQVVGGCLVGWVGVELDAREVERLRLVQGGPSEDTVHGIQRLVDGSAPVLLAGDIAVLGDIDVYGNGIARIHVGPADVVHK